MMSTPALLDPPVIGSRHKTAVARVRAMVPRRLWDLEEFCGLLNRGSIEGREPYSVATLRQWISRGEMPAVALDAVWAADRARPGWRAYRIPAPWIGRWFDLKDRTTPILTTRDEIGDPDDPPWLNVNDAGLAIGVSHTTMWEFVRLGLLESTTTPSGVTVIRTQALDDWLFRLIRLTEAQWFNCDTHDVEE